MSILKRFKDIMSANINTMLDKAEDPAKMVDQILRNLNDDLNKVKAETASIMAEVTRSQRQLDECNQEIDKLMTYAKKAIDAGNDDDARVFLGKKATLSQKQLTLQEQVNIASDNAQRMRQMHDKLMNEINELNQRRTEIKTKVASANMQNRLNEIEGSLNSSTQNMGAFARMEEKANTMLDQANAMAQLNAKPVDETSALMDKYGSASSSIEDELSSLKQQSSPAIEDELSALKNTMND